MLVYANHLKFSGDGAEEAIFKGIGGWLKEQLGFGLRPDEIRQQGDFTGKRGEARSWLRVYATEDGDPALYSWVMKNQDEEVRGRHWITELGLKIQHGEIELSCALRTDEHSTLVAKPVIASRPRVIGYVVNNVEKAANADLFASVSGITVKHVGEDIDSYHALLATIERRDRDCAIVLLSPTREGQYLLNATDLQEKLLGIGQVVQVSPDFNSYEMAEILGEHQSAWSGAINILYVPNRNGIVRSRLFRSDDIEDWGNTQRERASQVLAWVTNNTNVIRLRNHIRPDGVVQLALRRRLQNVQARRNQMNAAQLRDELSRFSQLVAEQTEWITTVEKDNADLQAELSETKTALTDERDQARLQQFVVQSLKAQLQQVGTDTSTTHQDAEELLTLACRTEPPTPVECLDAIEGVYSERCTVLPSARESAVAMERFEHGRRLLDMLRRLVTDYRTKLIEAGDNEARKVFGNKEYAAKESETVMANQAMRRLRTFQYEGKPVEMFRHLKIGIEANVTKTIRVHFHWDSGRERIVIGYCGEHLSVASH